MNHLPVLHPATVSLLGDVRENLATHRGEGKRVPIPTIYNTILIAPPIGLENKLQLRGGNFPGSSPSVPGPEGADWPHQDNTFGKKQELLQPPRNTRGGSSAEPRRGLYLELPMLEFERNQFKGGIGWHQGSLELQTQ